VCRPGPGGFVHVIFVITAQAAAATDTKRSDGFNECNGSSSTQPCFEERPAHKARYTQLALQDRFKW